MNLTRHPLALAAFLAAISSSWAQVFEIEPNNTVAQATAITLGLSVSGQLSDQYTEVDVFKVNVTEAGVLSIRLAGDAGPDGNNRYTLGFLNSAGILQANYAFVQPNSFVQTVNVPTPGVYYIRISPPDYQFTYRFTSNQYSLSVIYAPLAPTITAQPTDQNVAAGTTATLAVAANGAPPLSYQWFRNNSAVSGGTGEKLIFPSVSASDAGSYTVQIRNAAGSVTSVAATLTVIPLPNPSRLINLSVLTMILPNGTLTAGFVVGGNTNRRVLARAVGPTLVAFGVIGAMADPRLTLLNQQRVPIAANDNWALTDAGTMASVGAFALPSFSRDAATVATLAPGNYTVEVTGVGGLSGMALVEVYEVP